MTTLSLRKSGATSPSAGGRTKRVFVDDNMVRPSAPLLLRRRAKLSTFRGRPITLLLLLIAFVAVILWRQPPTTTTQLSASFTSALDSMGLSQRRGSRQLEYFQPVSRTVPLEDRYITLWLHQVHRWFANDDEKKSQIRQFLHDAKAAGFTSVMGDIPWEWTEREQQGHVHLDTWGKDWMQIACELDLKLHVVISMREAPQWLQAQSTLHFFEYGAALQETYSGVRGTPNMAHPIVWSLMTNFVRQATRLLLDRYGTCVHTVSPTVNNEFETRFVQTHNNLQDYSRASVTQFKEWQVTQGMVVSKEEGVLPPRFTAGSMCLPLQNETAWAWLGFREDQLAKSYGELCKVVKESTLIKDEQQPPLQAKCLLHFGEMFATTDLLNSNPFFQLASSPYVDDLVMDSNMALSGAPSSPSIVGILVSVAQGHGKTVHYEAATERVLACNDQGELEGSNLPQDVWQVGGGLLLHRGIEHSLNAGVQSIGITNLCKPQMAVELFGLFAAEGDATVKTSLPFQPTAIIFVPYRAFYAWKSVISGFSCSTGSFPCWHESLATVPFAGDLEALKQHQPGQCPVDVAQDALIQAWDDLRTRHAHVAIVGQVEKLTPKLLRSTTERLLLRFPCLMDDGETWNFWQGATQHKAFVEATRDYPFTDHVVPHLLQETGGSCS